MSPLHETLYMLAATVGLCVASPKIPVMSRDIAPEWPELLGPNNFPDTEHLTQVHDAIDPDSGMYATLVNQPGATAFWNTLWAITKSHPDRNWIKSMFESPSDAEKNEGKVKVVLFESPSLKKSQQMVSSKPIADALTKDDEGGVPPLWPLVLAEAAFAAGWRPTFHDDEASQLLEIFTGRQATSITTFGGTNAYWDAIADADTVPTVVAYPDANPDSGDVGWYVITTTADRAKGQAGYCSAPLACDYFGIGSNYPKSVVTLADRKPFNGRPAGS